MKDDETFAARWARRKLEAKRSKPAGASGSGSASAPAVSSTPEDDTPLPSLDDITPEGDVAAFLQKRVPEQLRRLALRKAWTSDPAISRFIEVAENQYDWNAIDGVPGFGPMDPSWNIDALLAQATGALGQSEDQPPLSTSTTSVADAADAAGSSKCDILTHPGDGQPTVASVGHQSMCDAPHNAPTGEDLLSPTLALASSDQPLFGLANLELNEASPSDITEKTQRLALQHTDLDRRGRHGGALPE
jgi:Protein of unknown function (DUF3306)